MKISIGLWAAGCVRSTREWLLPTNYTGKRRRRGAPISRSLGARNVQNTSKNRKSCAIRSGVLIKSRRGLFANYKADDLSSCNTAMLIHVFQLGAFVLQ